jgi:hypothetical protein
MAQTALKNEVRTGPAGVTKTTDLSAAPQICHDLFEETCVAFARGASDWGTKVVEAMATSTNNAFAFAGELATAKSWPEVAAVYTSQSRKQFDTLTGLTREFAELNRKFATDMLAPVTSGLPEVLKTIGAARWR